MKTRLMILAAILMTLSAYVLASEKKSDKIEIKENRIYLNGELFYIKGICYNPFYPGKGQGGITFKFLPEEIKEKDFSLMKMAGFNTIRIYTRMPNEFYDMAHSFGFKVIEPVLETGGYTNVRHHKTLQEYKSNAVSRVMEMKDHPSILMWSLWNDAPFKKNIVQKYGKTRVDKFYREIYDAIKETDPAHPVTGANMINAQNGWDMGFRFLDVIGCNTYLGLDHQGSAWNNVNFAKSAARRSVTHMSTYSRRFKKPVIITEIGCPTHVKYDKQGEIIEKQLKIIGEKIAGVCIFEWTDEWWKGGKHETQDFHIEDHWGIMNAHRKPKPGYEIIKKYFQAIPTNSKGYNSVYLK